VTFCHQVEKVAPGDRKSTLMAKVSGEAAAKQAWDALAPGFRIALDEAWDSWRAGSAGVGAAILDADDNEVARGRNRRFEPRAEPGILADTVIAHGEMNALAVLPQGPRDGLTLYTTFEPCIMCASAILMSNIPRVTYLTPDPIMADAHDAIATMQFAAHRMPERVHHGGPFGVLAYLLHVSWLDFWLPEHVLEPHRVEEPRAFAAAQEFLRKSDAAAIADAGGSVLDVATATWDLLQELV
jgi:tRNA(Arg) A34 adenosine deaminase TadA